MYPYGRKYMGTFSMKNIVLLFISIIFFSFLQNASAATQEQIRILKEAAQQGKAFAQTKLGLLYLNGDGIEKDPKEAFRLFQLAADQNYPQAYNELGLLYRKGIFVPKNLATAVRYYQKSANFDIFHMLSNRLECHKVPCLPRKTT